jgi:hypothetical protein
MKINYLIINKFWYKKCLNKVQDFTYLFLYICIKSSVNIVNDLIFYVKYNGKLWTLKLLDLVIKIKKVNGL